MLHRAALDIGNDPVYQENVGEYSYKVIADTGGAHAANEGYAGE
jgi:hypothetical protein